MSWSYTQKNGDLLLNGAFVARGYSGFGVGKNDPSLSQYPDVGPIPCGLWTVCGPPVDTEAHGPFVLRLEPDQCTDTFGRSGFLIHGDSTQHLGSASHGCLILAREVRETMWASGDRVLSVVSGIPLLPPEEET